MPKGSSIRFNARGPEPIRPRRICGMAGYRNPHNSHGLCSRHVQFARRRGSVNAPLLGAGPGYAEPAQPFREIFGVQVYKTISGRFFVISSNGRKGQRRSYGILQQCPGCALEFFNAYPKRQTFCTNSCNKRRGRNWLSRKVVERGHITPLLADRWFQLIVRAAGKCHRCGSLENLECAHIISRQYQTTRWEIDNALCLCEACHAYFTRFPLDWEEYAITAIGKSRYEQLRTAALAREPVDYSALLLTLGGALEEIRERSAA